MQTWFEHRGDPRVKTSAWIGNGNNNFCHSFIEAAVMFGFTLKIAAPAGYAPDTALVRAAGTAVQLGDDAASAARGADLVVTDTWTSMGQEADQQKRIAAFAAYQANAKLMSSAHQDAIFLHCRPAHRGEEVTAEVIEIGRAHV